MTVVIIILRHFFDLLASSTSVSAEALACATGVVTDATARTVLTRHSTVATVNLAAIIIQNVLSVVITLGQVLLLFLGFGLAGSVGVGLFPTCTTEGSIVLQLVVRGCGSGTALVIKGISCRGALNQCAAWTTVSGVALATVVHVSVPCVVVRSEVGFFEQLSEVGFVGLDLSSFSNRPVVRKVPVGTASSVARTVIRTSSALA